MLRLPIFILVLDLVTYAWSLDRIVGGYEANITDFPYHLAVRKNFRYWCGGALIGPKYGLSAAHCFKGPGFYSVMAGSSLRDSGKLNIVQTVFNHPKYDTYRPDYDIAIMQFKKKFWFSPTIQPIKLPHKLDKISPGVAGVISGFGDMLHGSIIGGSKILRAAVVYVEDPDLCQNSYNSLKATISDRMICAWDKGKKDSCQGDSGGPFAINGVLHGIVSFGSGCADPKFPGVYAKVTSYLEFIRLNTKP